MDKNLENFAFDMLKNMGGGKLTDKMSEIGKLAESEDAKSLSQKLGDGSEILKAVQNGDSQALQCLLSSVLETEEGARIAKAISDMLK